MSQSITQLQPDDRHPRDKRRHVRIDHSAAVEISDGRERLSGRCIDISRTGMQVVVNLPATYQSVESITFCLPNSAESISLPCRLVRLHEESENGDRVLGVEFDFQTEAQLLLIDAFIRDTKSRQVVGETAEGDLRQIPRASCTILDAVVLERGIETLSIDNISTEGLLLSFRGRLEHEEVVRIDFRLPGDPRKIEVSGRVMYVIDNSFQGCSTAGIRFLRLGEVNRARLANFIVSSASGATLKALHQRLSDSPIDPRYRIGDAGRIESLVQALRRNSLPVYFLCERRLQIHELKIDSVDGPSGRFLTLLAPEIPDPVESPGHSVYFSFFLNGGSYYFKTEYLGTIPRPAYPRTADSCESMGRMLAFAMPSVIIQSEKRAHRRQTLEVEGEIRLSVQEMGLSGREVQGRLIDISQHGFLCEIEVDPDARILFQQGQQLRYQVREPLGMYSEGVVRHVGRLDREDGSSVLRIGVEAGIHRCSFSFRYYTPEEWAEIPLKRDNPHPAARVRNESLPIRYCDEQGREIAALVNATRLGVPASVVVIPPAFGKKKEALSPLAAALTANFRRLGRDVVVLRYDGTNRPGESQQDDPNPRKGYEMLRYTLSDGAGDLRATLRYVHDNPFFRPQEVVIVTFSMSALDARKLLAEPDSPRVDHWVSCMGVSTAQSVLGNVLGGIDIIGNYQMGIPSGIGGVLGHLIDLDVMARDLVVNKYAFVADARADMARIAIPVLWIFGTYDRWLSGAEIKDLMSVDSGGDREVLEIPCGHNLRTSDDAARAFKLISAAVLERLCGEPIEAIDPDREEVLRLIAEERERLENRPELDPEEYWHTYLVGSGGQSRGYDFYWDLPEFRRFLRTQIELLAPQDGERIADMGCGTGLLLEALVRHLADRPTPVRKLEVIAVDLVQEALDRARARWTRTVRAFPALRGLELQCLRMNLEPSRLLAVKSFIDDPSLDFDFLRDKIEGLRKTTVDLLKEYDGPELHGVMRGESICPETLRYLRSTLHDGHFHEVLDFNRAARFLLQRLETADLRDQDADPPPAVLEEELYRNLSADRLRFEALNFGNSDLRFNLPFREGSFNKIAASLFISYLSNPQVLLAEFHRLLRPGGLLLVSSMRPDSDVSLIFTNYVQSVQHDEEDPAGEGPETALGAARSMLNQAAGLFELEEEGVFSFYTGEELSGMLEASGFAFVTTTTSLGTPPQAVIAVGKKL